MVTNRPVTRAPVRRLKPSKYNVRTHSKKQIRQIADSVLQFGWTVPLVVDESQTVIAGHGRLLAAKMLGLARVPVITAPELSDSEFCD
jgi:ParB-like chromosome segregation protein Spo0J